jgi:PAS domain S-box-containing protein
MKTETNNLGTILVVDDTPGSIGVVQAALEGAGHRVAIATSGEKALQRAALVMPDLILLDVLMPGLDGYETCRRLKAQEATREIPVIFLSGLTETFDKVKAFGLGAVDYLIKPMAAEELLARVRTHVTIGRLERELRAANRTLEERVAARTAELRAANQQLVGEIEERKRTEEALAREQRLFAYLADNSPDYIYFKDRQSRFIRINAAHARLFRLNDPSEALGKTDFDFHGREHTRDAYADEQQIMTSGQPIIAKEEREDWPDGRTTWVSTTKIPLRDEAGNITGLVGISRDITERKRAEEALQKLNQELDQRVKERTAELETKNQELESFSYSVSHDLRAPLRSIDGFSRIVLEDNAGQLDAEGRKNLERVRAASQHMGQLIDDLLQLSRHTRSEMHRAPVDLSALARAVVEELQKTDPERRVELVIEPDLIANADAGLMRIVLGNLLDNAWKFTGRQAAAKIEFGRTTREGVPTFFVRDNGAGFDMAYVGKLFGAFQRLHATAEFPGTGIGLASVQRIIHRHGGHIEAESEVGHGATFYFSLSQPVQKGA